MGLFPWLEIDRHAILGAPERSSYASTDSGKHGKAKRRVANKRARAARRRNR